MTLRHAAFCIALAGLIPGAPALAQSTAPAKPGAAAPASTAPATAAPATGAPAAAPTSSTSAPAAQTPAAASASNAKKPTAAETALHARQTACGAEWRAAKEAGKVPAGQTWPKFWSACNKRLKAQGK